MVSMNLHGDRLHSDISTYSAVPVKFTMCCDSVAMQIRPAHSYTLTQCWYTRSHVPSARKERGEHGTLVSICRHCERPIRSHGGKSWTLADGVDLDELSSHSQIRYICVTDVREGEIIARYVLEADLDDEAVKLRCEGVIEKHGAGDPGSGLEVRVMGGTQH